MVRAAVLDFVVIVAFGRLLGPPTRQPHSGKSPWQVNIPLSR